MQTISMIIGLIATSLNFTPSTYTTLVLDVHSVGPFHENTYAAGPYEVDTAINDTLIRTFNKTRVWGDADNAAPWTSMLSTLTATVTDTVSGTYAGTLPAHKYLWMNYDMNGSDGTHTIKRTDYWIDESGDVPTLMSAYAIIRRDGYIRTATFVNFSITD